VGEVPVSFSVSTDEGGPVRRADAVLTATDARRGRRFRLGRVPVATQQRAGTILRMPPKKSDKAAGDSKPKKRIGVNIPEDWHAVMRKLAAKKKMPVLWYLLDLTMKDAAEQGIDTPAPPWEEEEASE